MLAEHLALLERSDLVRLFASAPELEYAFRHALVQDAAYTSLLRGQRAQWHRAAAEALEQMVLADSVPGPRREQVLDSLAPALAHHYAQAGQDDPALRYYDRAGEAAFRHYANTEAAGYFARAVSLARRQPKHESELVRHLYARLGRCLELTGQLEAALQTYSEMLALARTRGDQRLALAALMAQATMRSTASYVFDEAAAQTALQEARRLAHALGDPASEAHLSWTLLLRNTMTGGDPAERLALGETAVRLSRAHDLPEQLAYALLDVWYGYAGLGRWDESLASLAEARERWRALGNLAMQCEAESRIALTHMIAGDFRAGLAAVAQSYQTARAANSPHMQGLSRVFAGRMYLEQGRLAQSIEVMHDVIALGEATGNVTALIGTRADLAQAYGLLGEVETALALTGQALAAGVGRVDLLVPWPRGIAARLHVQQGALAAAEAQLAGLDHQRLRRQSGFMPSLWVNVGLAVVELALARGEPDPAAALARQLLADLHAWRITYVVPEVQGVLGQALLAAGRLVEARAALQSARMTALAIGARRQLWPILAGLAQVEEASGLTGAAGQLRAEARALIEDIAAHAPPTLRASFLAQPAIQTLLPPASADPSKVRS